MKTPQEHFNKKIIGHLITRTIDKLNLRETEEEVYRALKYEGNKTFEVLDIIDHDDNKKLYVVNEWANVEQLAVCCIHENFVKEYTNEQE